MERLKKPISMRHGFGMNDDLWSRLYFNLGQVGVPGYFISIKVVGLWIG